MAQGLAIEQIAQGQESLDGQQWRRRIVHEAACERIEHPHGNSQLKALLEFDDQTLRGLTSSPPDDFTCLAKEGMMMVTDTDYRRMMSSVEIPSGAASLDVHFISSLPVKQQPACMAWMETRPAQIAGVASETTRGPDVVDDASGSRA